jgi:hypothetical protein
MILRAGDGEAALNSRISGLFTSENMEYIKHRLSTMADVRTFEITSTTEKTTLHVNGKLIVSQEFPFVFQLQYTEATDASSILNEIISGIE